MKGAEGEGMLSPFALHLLTDSRRRPNKQVMGSSSRMTPEEFERLRPRLGRVSAATAAIAREVLVDGLSLTEAGQRNGLTRQRVLGIVRRVQAAASAVPNSWRRVEVWLPPQLAAEVEEMAQRARSELAGSVQDEAR